MIKRVDVIKSIKAKNLRDVYGYPYVSVLSMKKDNGLNCGCSICKALTKQRRSENKKARRSDKRFTNEIINDMLTWNYYDYYDPSEDLNPTQDKINVFGLPIYGIEYFKHIA